MHFLVGARTPLLESQIADQAKAHGLPKDRVLEAVILAPQAVKSLIEPDEVAAIVAFLLGPDGRAFTGAAVIMDQAGAHGDADLRVGSRVQLERVRTAASRGGQ
ncbi:MAG TPA: hypothetical protein VI296_05890 [Candidatus Dormibacteraeota bacterium]